MSVAAAAPPTAPTATRPPVPPLPGLGGVSPQNTASLRLPGQHFATALLFLCAGAVGLVWIAPELAAGLYLSPHVAAVTHCFTLGWLTMTIFGALYQLLPVALGVPIRSERVGHLSFWTFAPGVAVFATGVGVGSTALRAIGIILITTGIACLVTNVALSLRRAPVRNVIWSAVVIALVFLASTLVLGAALVHNLHADFLGAWRVRVLATHLHVAMIGWVLMMIVGISHRLLPMFLLAEGRDTAWTRRALALLAAGVIALATGLLASAPLVHAAASWTGIVLIEGGIVCFVVQAVQIYRARKRPRLDAGLRHVALALGFLCVSAVLGPIVMARGIGAMRLDTIYVMVGLLGGLVLYTVGQFYKIVPFLAWIARFRDDMGKKRVPTVADLYSQRAAQAGLAAFAAAIVLLATGVAAGSVSIARAGGLSFVAGVGVFVSQIARVAFGNATPKAPRAPRAPHTASAPAVPHPSLTGTRG